MSVRWEDEVYCCENGGGCYLGVVYDTIRHQGMNLQLALGNHSEQLARTLQARICDVEEVRGN